MRSIKSLAGALAGTLALAGVTALGAAAPAAAITPGAALSGTAGFGGYSSGTNVFTDVLNLDGDPDALRLSLSQSAAGVTVGEELVDQDLLGSSILTADDAGKNAYGHGAAANVGLLQAESAPPQVALSTAEALSPPPTVATPTELLALPLEPVANAQLLPSTAQAQTTTVGSACPTGDNSLISQGTAQVANAQVLPVLDEALLEVGDADPAQGVSSTVSQTGLVPPSGGASGFGLTTVTTQTLAPITLFGGLPGLEGLPPIPGLPTVPGDDMGLLNIEVLADLQVRTTATGGTGSEVFYGFVDADGEPVADDEEVLVINGQSLTSSQVLGGDGIQLSLGLADVFIGAPIHGLDDNPTSDPTVSSTTAAGAVDFIRVTIPGTAIPVGGTTPIADDSPLAPILNPVLQPVTDALAPVLETLQTALLDAGLGVADIRYGHFEGLSTVPQGGIDCGGQTNNEDPLRNAFKDVSALGVAPGATFDYTVRFPNDGSTPLTNVKVVDTFTGGPPPLEFVSSDPAPTSQQGNTLTYEIGTIEPGTFRDISFTFRVPANAPVGTRYSNSAVITATFEGRQIEKTVRIDAPTVIAAPTGACNVERSTKFASNKEVETGQEFAYFINVSNTGGQDCTGVVVTDELVGGVSFVSCSDNCTNAGQRVTFPVGTLTGGASRTLKIVVRVTATEGTLPNTGVITTEQGSTARPMTPGPRVTDDSVGNPGSPAGCPASGCPGTMGAGQDLPETGLGSTLPVLGVVALLLTMAIRRRRGDLIG